MRRIAFVTNFCSHYRRPLFETLAERLDVDFYFFATNRERPDLQRQTGAFREVRLRHVDLGRHAIIPALAVRLRSGRYDAVVKCLNGRLMVPLAYATSRAHGLPFVLWTGMWRHPETLTHRLTRPITEYLYRNADAVVAYGEHVRQFLLDIDGVRPDRVFVAGQAVDPIPFSLLKRAEPAAPEILFVGRLAEEKGVPCLLDAFERLGQDANARLTLVGEGPLGPHIRRRMAGRRNMELVGQVPHARLTDYLARARCLVLPSITTDTQREPWGLVVNEAMHAGVPVVATDAVGAAAGGLVRSGRNGYVVPERDPAALAAAIQALMADPNLAARLGRHAREDAAAFTFDAMADAFENAVEAAIGARG